MSTGKRPVGRPSTKKGFVQKEHEISTENLSYEELTNEGGKEPESALKSNKKRLSSSTPNTSINSSETKKQKSTPKSFNTDTSGLTHSANKSSQSHGVKATTQTPPKEATDSKRSTYPRIAGPDPTESSSLEEFIESVCEQEIIGLQTHFGITSTDNNNDVPKSKIELVTALTNILSKLPQEVTKDMTKPHQFSAEFNKKERNALKKLAEERDALLAYSAQLSTFEADPSLMSTELDLWVSDSQQAEVTLPAEKQQFIQQSEQRYKNLLTSIEQRGDAVLSLADGLIDDISTAKNIQEHFFDTFQKVRQDTLVSSAPIGGSKVLQTVPPKDVRDVIRKMPALFDK